MKRFSTIHRQANSGFTLIELLVVIAIIAILALVVVVVLNPAELIKQSRDSARLNDLSTMKTAVSYYLTDVVANPNLAVGSGYSACYLSTPSAVGTSTAKCGMFASGGITSISSSSAANFRKTDSTGWLPVNFSQISVGSPLGQLPVDPMQASNPMTAYYGYAATSSNNSFKLGAFLESQKYGTMATTDGGTSASVYEIGSNMAL
jgi:prepilin-type N-terminal cleavage/methylation domain-containing protein